jgi:hypothetical protein
MQEDLSVWPLACSPYLSKTGLCGIQVGWFVAQKPDAADAGFE